MKNSLTLPSLANKSFYSLRNDNDEPIYTCTDGYMHYFVRHPIKGGHCSRLNQYYKSIISDKVFLNFSKELDINGNNYEILPKYFEFT